MAEGITDIVKEIVDKAQGMNRKCKKISCDEDKAHDRWYYRLNTHHQNLYDYAVKLITIKTSYDTMLRLVEKANKNVNVKPPCPICKLMKKKTPTMPIPCPSCIIIDRLREQRKELNTEEIIASVDARENDDNERNIDRQKHQEDMVKGMCASVGMGRFSDNLFKRLPNGGFTDDHKQMFQQEIQDVLQELDLDDDSANASVPDLPTASVEEEKRRKKKFNKLEPRIDEIIKRVNPLIKARNESGIIDNGHILTHLDQQSYEYRALFHYAYMCLASKMEESETAGLMKTICNGSKMTPSLNCKSVEVTKDINCRVCEMEKKYGDLVEIVKAVKELRTAHPGRSNIMIVQL